MLGGLHDLHIDKGGLPSSVRTDFPVWIFPPDCVWCLRVTQVTRANVIHNLVEISTPGSQFAPVTVWFTDWLLIRCWIVQVRNILGNHRHTVTRQIKTPTNYQIDWGNNSLDFEKIIKRIAQVCIKLVAQVWCFPHNLSYSFSYFFN